MSRHTLSRVERFQRVFRLGKDIFSEHPGTASSSPSAHVYCSLRMACGEEVPGREAAAKAGQASSHLDGLRGEPVQVVQEVGRRQGLLWREAPEARLPARLRFRHRARGTSSTRSPSSSSGENDFPRLVCTVVKSKEYLRRN